MLINIDITHLEQILFGDNVGGDISQKDDSNMWIQYFITQKGTRANKYLAIKMLPVTSKDHIVDIYMGFCYNSARLSRGWDIIFVQYITLKSQ